jgi:PII-like signaling protein
MAERDIKIARIYLREAEHLLPRIIKFLHDEEKVCGVTVLRGIAGFSGDGKIHTASLVDLSLDLPLVVEFFDEPERVKAVVAGLMERVAVTHVAILTGKMHTRD